MHAHRSWISAFQRTLDAARQEIDKGLAIEPGHTLLRHVAGYLYLQRGDLEPAMMTLEGVLRRPGRGRRFVGYRS